MSEVPLYKKSLVLGGGGAAGLDADYRVTLLIRNSAPLGPYNRNMPLGPCGGSRGGGLFLMSEVPLY